MRSPLVLSVMLASLTMLVAALPTQAQTMGPGPAPEAAPGDGVATYAPPPSANGLFFSVGQGLTLLSLDSPDPKDAPPFGSTPDASLRVGYRLDSIVAWGSLGYNSVGAFVAKGNCVELDPNYEEGCKTWESAELGTSMLTIGAGAKYLFEAPGPGLTSPYAVAGIYLGLPGGSASNEALQKALDDLYAGALGFGFLLGGGAEYFVGEGFSVGGEAGLSYMGMSWKDGGMSTSTLQIFTSVTLNFYL